jgi:putative peptidoglycan lipid II flippase
MVVHALPLTRVVFERGQFSFANSAHTADMLKVYSLGLLPNAMAVMFLRFFYAVQDTVTPLLVELGNLAWYALAAPYLSARYGLVGLGAARAVSFTLVAVVLLLAMQTKLRGLRFSLDSLTFVVQVGFASFVMSVVTFSAAVSLGGLFQGHGSLMRTLVVIALALLGGIAYTGICYLFKLREVHAVIRPSLSRLLVLWKLGSFGETSL